MKSYELSYANQAFEKEQDLEEKRNEINKKAAEGKEGEEGSLSSASTDEEDDGKVSCMKVSKTVALTFSLACLAIFLEIAGSSLEYLQQLISGTTEEITQVLIARSVGYFLGSIVGGYLCDRYSRMVDIFIGGTFILGAIGTTAAPWCNSRVLLGIMFFLQGITQGTVCTGGNAVVIKLWGKSTDIPLVAQHLAFGIGALTAPQLVSAFITRETVTSTSSPFSTTPQYNSSLPLNMSTPSTTITDWSEVMYAYIIAGALAFSFGIMFFIFYFVDNESKDIGPSLNPREILHPGSCADGDAVFSIIFFSLFFAINVQTGGGERYFSRFFFKFTQSSFGYDETQAANILSLFWLCFSLGRAANLVAVHFLSPVVIMLILGVGNLSCGTVFAFVAINDELALRIVCCFLGFFLSPLFPTGLVWANLYIHVTAVGVSLGYVATATGDLVYQYLGGYLFDSLGPDTFVYIIFVYSVLLAFFIIVAQIVSSKHGRRVSKPNLNTDKEENAVVVVTISNFSDELKQKL